jgi:SAM-dependent methyltransferase
MDDPRLDRRRLRVALGGLRRINRVSGSAAAMFNALAAHLPASSPARLLDIATGAGDVPIGLARRAASAGRRWTVEGCDVNRGALACARLAARRARVPVRFFRLDALADPIPGGYDVVMCSLFLHHLGDGDARELLGRMGRAARHLVIVSDLNRCGAGFIAAAIVPRLLTGSAIVHGDALRSVRAAFTLEQARALAGAAGMPNAVARRQWPFRWMLTWSAS